jgi:hypothetical protein
VQAPGPLWRANPSLLVVAGGRQDLAALLAAVPEDVAAAWREPPRPVS